MKDHHYDKKFRKLLKKEICETLGINTTTLGRWITEGLELHSWTEFCKWIKTNKKTHRGANKAIQNWSRRIEYEKNSKNKKEEEKPQEESQESESNEEELETGAAHALSRLEQIEIDQYKKMIQAQKDRDLIAEEHYAKQHLQTTQALRALQAALWKEKVEMGETIPKPDARKIIMTIWLCIQLAEERFLDKFCLEVTKLDQDMLLDEHQIRQHFKGWFYDSNETCMEQALNDGGKVPEWVFECINEIN